MTVQIKNVHPTATKVRLLSGGAAAVVELVSAEGTYAVHLTREALETLVLRASRELGRDTHVAERE